MQPNKFVQIQPKPNSNKLKPYSNQIKACQLINIILIMSLRITTIKILSKNWKSITTINEDMKIIKQTANKNYKTSLIL